MPLSPGDRIGPNEVISLSGSGSMGRNEGGVQHLIRQLVDLVGGGAGGPAVKIAAVQIYPAWFADSIGSPTSTVDVSKDRVYFNSVELRGNVWITSLQ